MSTSAPPTRQIGRRTLAALMAAGIVVPVLGVPQAAQAAPPVTFVLNAEVLDGGQQITSITIDTGGMGPVDPSSLSVETFTVHATATSPSPELDPKQLFFLYDLDRTVTDIGVDDSGDIVVELLHGEGVPGAATLAYSVQTSRNVQVDLEYSVTQNLPVLLASGESASFGGFKQGATVDPEVDRFSQAVSPDGINYRLYSPSVRGNAKRALIVWLHGNGEGGMAGHYNNTSQLLANRGALGPATAQAQAIFKGAFVLAPQVPDTWYNLDQEGYAERIKALIDSVVASHRIDNGRVYVMGASAGGFMTVQMASRYPTAFAAIVATCPALYLSRTGQYTTTEEQVLALNSTPTWFIHAKNDTTVPYDKASVWAYELLDDARITLYDNVVWDGYEFPGHFAWVYTARNDPTTAGGLSVWEWLARQTARHPGVKK